MQHQGPARSCGPVTSPHFSDSNSGQQPAYPPPEQQNIGYYHPSAHVSTNLDTCPQPSVVNDNNHLYNAAPRHHFFPMPQHQHQHQHQQQSQTPRADMLKQIQKDANPSSMTYNEAVEIVNAYCPEALEAIKAAHVHSTRPVILALRDENIFLKHRLIYCGNEVPGLVDPSYLQKLYAEQPEAFPVPPRKTLLYGPPYAPISPISSIASSPTKTEAMTPTSSAGSKDAELSSAPQSIGYHNTSKPGVILTTDYDIRDHGMSSSQQSYPVLQAIPPPQPYNVATNATDMGQNMMIYTTPPYSTEEFRGREQPYGFR
ncbi:hypothetical protein K504DRAFT_137885 [Pleomassaria siparia CBS 279.74]|uniref:Uncharacterized protein n=1 Tax=Pleomassaria siparia CBS 279.74 TaxID=1314801 RepID=A0A6G1KM23_9PLEO|nr:hypothetical protein K504DRAFT_137885 [Pleomassaria siparia CBS 279.74]